MLSTIIEPQLSVNWDTTKTKRYTQQSPIYLTRKNIGIVHVWRHQGGRKRFCQLLIEFVFLAKVYCFFLTRAGGVKSLYFLADVILEWSLTNKNKLQFTLDDLNSDGDKVIIMVHRNNYRKSQVSNMNFYIEYLYE